MTKFKQYAVISFLGIAMVFAPVVGFAKDNERGEDNHDKAKAKVEQRAYLRAALKDYKNSDSDHEENSIFERILNLFGARADAAVSTTASLTPSISGITSPTVLKAGVEGTWTIKASDPQNGALSYFVDWGEKSNIAKLLNKEEKTFVQTGTFTHTYANPGTYTVKFTVKNSAGLSASSSVSLRVTGSMTQNEPVISNLSVKSNSYRQAVLRWATDIPANSRVWYDTESSVDTSGKAQVSRKGRVINHNVVLTGLEAGIKYYVVVGSANKDGSMTKSSEISFTTRAKTDRLTPVITSLSGDTSVVVGEETTLIIKAYDSKNNSLTYSADWGDNISGLALLPMKEAPFVQSATFTHIYGTPGIYTAKFTAQNSAGLKATSTVKITVTEDDEDSINS